MLLAAVSLTACPRGVDVSLGDPERVDSLTIVVGNDEASATRLQNVDLLSVYTCSMVGHAPRWIIQRSIRDARFNIRRVLYGKVPPGWAISHRPEQLTPGCYAVHVAGSSGESGGFEFDVVAGGRIRKR
jgi:hypothetical protein